MENPLIVNEAEIFRVDVCVGKFRFARKGEVSRYNTNISAGSSPQKLAWRNDITLA
jgi:hypothetical protein